jgi:peptide/nickel transport system permease protein
LTGANVTTRAIATLRPTRRLVPTRFWRSSGAVALGVLVLLMVLAWAEPLIAGSPYGADATQQVAAPSTTHLFGTDQFGFDVFARVLYAGRIDLTIPLIGAALALVVGVPIGALAGLKGGRTEQFLLRIAEGFQAFPGLLLAMGVAAALGPSLINLAIVIAIINIPIYLRLARNAVVPLREAEYVVMARTAGRSTGEILRLHLLPNLREVFVAQYTVSCAWGILILAGLSFIGIGVEIPKPEWGAMIQLGTNYLATGQWWISVFPGLTIFISCLALNTLADSIRSAGRVQK